MYEGVKGRKPTHKRVSKESDWKTYYGSNKHLKEAIEKHGVEEFERYIIKIAPSKKLLTYYETQYQFIYQVLEKPEEFYNDNILGKFFTKDFEN
jgi:dissimilatory sulfite reductase (desulfoviridin) alpha/beta subunit